MISNILAALFQVCITALLLRIYHDVYIRKNIGKPPIIPNWDEASIALDKLEARLILIQTRESAVQERVWQLEDENRILKTYVKQMQAKISGEYPKASNNSAPATIVADVADEDEDR